MSTYNGELHLKEQIDSILNQENVEINLIIRDDGSTDNTLKIVNSISDERAKDILGKNVGWKEGFNILTRNCEMKTEFYAFSDQDDVWYKNKIINAIKKFKSITTYQHYFIMMQLLLMKGLIKLDTKRTKAPLITNIVNCAGQGCYTIFNSHALLLFRAYQPKEVFSHEHWLIILCAYFGKYVMKINHTYNIDKQEKMLLVHID